MMRGGVWVLFFALFLSGFGMLTKMALEPDVRQCSPYCHNNNYNK